MSARGVPDSDSLAVRRAARSVARRITIASSAGVVIVVLIAVVFVVAQSTPAELLERPRPGEHKIYIDSSELLVAVAVIGVLAIALAGIASTVIAARAVRPLGDALRLQREFVADASHELRTPLAILDARLQAVQRSVGPEDPAAPGLAKLREDSRALAELVTDLLLAADPDRHQGQQHDGAAVADVVGDVVEGLTVLAEQRRIDLAAEVAADTGLVTLSPAALRRCLIALLENALAHSAPGARVRVTGRIEHGRVALRVVDEGDGIPADEVAGMFDRFARGDPARVARRGFGLGLAVVRDVVVRAGGTVAVETTSSAGTVIRLELPRPR